MTACSLAPTLFSFLKTPSGVPSPLKKKKNCLATFVDISAETRRVEALIFTAHIHYPSLFCCFLTTYFFCHLHSINIFIQSIPEMMSPSPKSTSIWQFQHEIYQSSVMYLSEMPMNMTPSPCLLTPPLSAPISSTLPPFSSSYPLSLSCHSLLSA